MQIRFDNSRFERCKVADEYFVGIEKALWIDEQHFPNSAPIRLLRMALTPGSYPVPAISEINIYIFFGTAGHANLDVGLGSQTCKIESGLMGVGPSATDCDYVIDAPTELLMLNMAAPWLRWAFEQRLPGFNGGDFGLVHEGAFHDTTIEAIVSRLWSEVAAGCAERMLLETGSLTIASLLLMRSGRDFRQAEPAARGGLSPFRLKRVEAVIGDRLSEDLSIAELADEAGLSHFHFTRAFKASTGETPHRYLVARRIARAQEMLVSTDLPVTEIALACGFASSQHFATAFRRSLNTTPSMYRAKMRS